MEALRREWVWVAGREAWQPGQPRRGGPGTCTGGGSARPGAPGWRGTEAREQGGRSAPGRWAEDRPVRKRLGLSARVS